MFLMDWDIYMLRAPMEKFLGLKTPEFPVTLRSSAVLHAADCPFNGSVCKSIVMSIIVCY